MQQHSETSQASAEHYLTVLEPLCNTVDVIAVVAVQHADLI